MSLEAQCSPTMPRLVVAELLYVNKISEYNKNLYHDANH